MSAANRYFKRWNMGLRSLLLFFSFIYIFPSLAEEEDNVFDLSLDELINLKVTSVTKQEAKLTEVPASITVITKQDIIRYGYRTVSELVNSVAGFSAIDNLVYADFGVRGSHAGLRAGNRVFKVLVNGQSINFRSNGHNYLGESLVPLSIVNHVEVIRGPASTIYGANAFLGVINVVTDSDYNSVSSQVNFHYENFANAEHGYSFDASLKNKKEKYQYLFGFSTVHYDRAGLQLPKVSPEYSVIETDDSRHVVTEKDKYQPINVFFHGQYKLTDTSNIEMQAMYQEIDANNAFSDVTPLFSSGYSRVNLINQHVSLGYSFDVSSAHKIRTKLNISKGRSGDKDIVEIGAQDYFLRRRSQFNALDIQIEMSSDWGKSNSTLIGIDHSDEDYLLEYFERVERDGSDVSSFSPIAKIPIDNTGLYLQWQHQLFPSVNTIVGIRQDNHSINSAEVSSKFGVTWTAFDNVTIKLLSGESFQSPTVQLWYRDAVQAGDIIGNEKLRPQRAKTEELILNWKINPYTKLDTTLFQTKISDLVVFKGDFVNLFAENSRQSEAYGVEIELKHQRQGWNGYVNYSYHHTDISRDETSLFVLEYRKHGELMPEHIVNSGLSYLSDNKQWLASVEHKYVSTRQASSQNVLLAQQFYQLDSYHHTNALFKYFINIGGDNVANIEVKIKNLFDNRYVHPGFGGIDYPSLGRSVELGFHREF